jgi:hypothetical protein
MQAGRIPEGFYLFWISVYVEIQGRTALVYLHIAHLTYDDVETLSRMSMTSEIHWTHEDEVHDGIDAWFDASDEEEFDDSEPYNSRDRYLNHREPLYGDIIECTIVSIQHEVHAEQVKSKPKPKPKSFSVAKKRYDADVFHTYMA